MTGKGHSSGHRDLVSYLMLVSAASAVLAAGPMGCKPKDITMTQPDAAPSQTMVVMKTSHGTIRIQLHAEKAPITVANFLKYVDERHYDGTVFHRVMPGFMIQGGGFQPGMKEKTTHAPIRNESANGLTNVVGSLAMARTSDPHSASAQFFVNLADNGFLNKAQAQDGWGYAVFGKVVEGMDVVNKIAAVKTETVDSHQHVPVEPVMIVSAQRLEQ